MRIGYILWQFPVLSETFILNELIELTNKGQEVYIFSLTQPQEEIVHPEVKKYGLLEKTYYLPGYVKLGLELPKPQSWAALFSKGYEGKSAKAKLLGRPFYAAVATYFSRIIMKLELDVLHAHFYGVPSYIAMLISRQTSIPFTFTCHAVDIFVNPNPDVMRRHMEAAAKVITISNYNRNYLHELTDSDKDKIKVIRACPMLGKFKDIEKDEADAKTILTVSRLVEKKGIKYGVLAVAELIKEFPQLRYKIIGNGSLENEIQALVRSLQLGDNVEFLGKTNDEFLLDELSRATIVVLPCIEAQNGDKDGIPVTLMEAMYSQTPVISTSVSGIPELIENGEEGLLVEPMNVERLADRIKTLLKDKGLRIRMGRKGREKVEKEFNIHREVEDLLKIWDEVKR